MKKQNLLFLAFAAISIKPLESARVAAHQEGRAARGLQREEGVTRRSRPADDRSGKSLSKTKSTSKKESGFLDKFFSGKKEDEVKVSDSSGVKAKRTEKHRYISKKNVQNMKESDISSSIDSELEAGKLYRAEYISSLETLTKVDEEIKQTLAKTSSTYKMVKNNKKNNKKIIKSKFSSLEDINSAKIQLEAVKKHESTIKEAEDMRKRLAEKTEGVKKNYNQVKKNLKALSVRGDSEQKALIKAFLSVNPNQAAQDKLRAEKKALQARKAAVRQAKRGRREEAMNRKHGGAAQSAAYVGGMQKFIEEKRAVDAQIKNMRMMALNQATESLKNSPEFKTLSAADKNKKNAELRKKAQVVLQKNDEYIALNKKKQVIDQKIVAYRKAQMEQNK